MEGLMKEPDFKTDLDNQLFEVNGYKCGYDGVFVWHINEEGHEETIGFFEDISLLEITSHCAVFYSDCLKEYLSFDGEAFGNINLVNFEIVPAHNEEELIQMPEMWEQVRIFIDDDDIINKIGSDNDFHWGIESSSFLDQKDAYYKGNLHIGVCACTAEGDDDIVADVDSSKNYISWKIYHDRNPDKNAVFIFEKHQYSNAINEAIKQISKKRG
jgi:hypothetical protein